MFAGFVSLAFLNHGFPGRLPEYLLPAELARRTNTPRDECFRNANSTKKTTETYCSFGSAQAAGRPSAILWGDSFANQYLEPISSAALGNGIHGLIATQSACRAFVDDAASNAGDQPPCRQFNRSTLDFVLGQAEPSIVVLGSNWGSAAEISALVDRLLSAGKTVVLIMPLLNIGFDLPQRWIENQIRAGRAIDEWKVEAGPGLTMSAFRNEIARVLDRYRDNPHLVVVDPLSVVCEHGYCYLVRNGQANFRDTAQFPTSMRASTAACSTLLSGRRSAPGRKRRRKRTERRVTSGAVCLAGAVSRKIDRNWLRRSDARQAVALSAGTPQSGAGRCGKSET